MAEPGSPDPPTEPLFAWEMRPADVHGPTGADQEVCARCHWPLLAEISTLVASMSTDFDEVLLAILDAAVRLSGGDRGFLMLFTEQGRLRVRVAHNLNRESLENGVLRVSQTVIGRVLRKRRGVALPSLPGADPEGPLTSSIAELGLRSVICVPLKLGDPAADPREGERRRLLLPNQDDIVGVIYVDGLREASRFDDYDLEVLQSLANHATAVILNARLYHLATCDSLTGVATRKHLQQRLDEELRVAARTGETCGVVFLDVDAFKEVNDRHGHQRGDAVLRALARVLKRHTRGCGLCGRYGGDEFVAVRTGCDEPGLARAAEQIREDFHRAAARLVEEPVHVSLGCAISPSDGGDAASLLDAADRRMYQEKARRSGGEPAD